MNHHNAVKLIHSEFSIQNLLFERLTEKQHQFIFPNVRIAFWEADLISVTRAGYLHEYEIKISRSDYKADFKKLSKHQWLGNVRLRESDRVAMSIPAFFWYVAPEGVIQCVPSYAGLIEVDWRPNNRYAQTGLQEIVSAPRLHSTKISRDQKNLIYRSAQWKLWNARKRVESCIIQRRLFKNVMREI